MLIRNLITLTITDYKGKTFAASKDVIENLEEMEKQTNKQIQ